MLTLRVINNCPDFQSVELHFGRGGLKRATAHLGLIECL